MPSSVVAARLVLQPAFSRNVSQERSDSTAYRLQVTVTEAENVSDAIFVYIAVPPYPGSSDGVVPNGSFEHVATPADLEEMPEAAPDDSSENRYRLNSVDLYYRSVTELQQAYDDIVRRVELLVYDLEQLTMMDMLTPLTYEFNTLVEDGSSAAE